MADETKTADERNEIADASDMDEQMEAMAARISGTTCATVEKPTLFYFDINGIAWPIRCLLHLAGVDYDYVKISIELWKHTHSETGKSLKHSFKNGHVPRYVDGEVDLGQSQVLMFHLAEKHGLLGDGGAAQRLAAMEVMAHAYDLFHWAGLFGINAQMGRPDELQDALVASFLHGEKSPRLGSFQYGLEAHGYNKMLDGFVNYLEANQKSGRNNDKCNGGIGKGKGSGNRLGFMVGDTLTAADLAAFNVLCNWYKKFDPGLFVERYPQLEEYVQRVAAVPKVAEFIRTKQEATTWFSFERKCRIQYRLG